MRNLLGTLSVPAEDSESRQLENQTRFREAAKVLSSPRYLIKKNPKPKTGTLNIKPLKKNVCVKII